MLTRIATFLDTAGVNAIALRDVLITFGLRVGTVIVLVVLFVIIGRYTSRLVKLIIRRFLPRPIALRVQTLIDPITPSFSLVGTLILITLTRSLTILQPYPPLYITLEMLTELGLVAGLAWLTSRLLRQFVEMYGVDIIDRLGQGVNELLLVCETAINIVIWTFAVVFYAQNQNVNVVGLLTGVGIGGLAIAFAAQKTLEQLLGTVVLYLDSPFKPGEYIRYSTITGEVYGRIESIGLRSTKIRTAAKNTLLIVPNSIMANLDIENITRGKKIMVLLYLDFPRVLGDREKALVQQVVVRCTNTIYGIDPGSTNIALLDEPEAGISRARVTFFILGSTENSIQIRKRLLELANERISSELKDYGIEFEMLNEPTIYVESPITL
ncbi:MAG: mechanosensitive ion channel [Synechococcales cyanobacterium K44_A2020_017]|jgi:small-conductance mechanosensitive channel|nr:mechanosensitive ion channel [Synechococcales cyanobacterium K32_A2020_035]MBF2095492.1 mechanosensitive ion channel [Synechococcales cyanobacterium K44_A2020_017]